MVDSVKKDFIVSFQPDDISVTVCPDTTLMEVANLAGIVLNAACGGKGICGKCWVILLPEDREVLACQHRVIQDLTVKVPGCSRLFEHKILEQGVSAGIEIHPAVCKKYIPTGHMREAFSLKEYLDGLCADEKYNLSENARGQLDEIIDDERGFTAVCHLGPESIRVDSCEFFYNVAALEPGDTTGYLFGVAVDIGTTTVAARLINMLDGTSVANKATYNPQNRFGDDVVSRISQGGDAKGLGELRTLIHNCIDELVAELCKKANIAKDHIYELSVVGNTCMNHIFLGWPIKKLGVSPYEPYSLDSNDNAANSLGLNSINPWANIHTSENIAGFVGSDITAGAVAVDIDRTEKKILYIDIGTNGELMLAAGGQLYSASCAAGPALEGARITCGSRAMDGAIEAVFIKDEDIALETIGTNQPQSICGSGLIDAAATMLDLGIIDNSGRFIDKKQLVGKVSPTIHSRITTIKDQPSFVLSYDEKSGKPAVYLNQADIRQLQLAKAAIIAGVKLLLKKNSLEPVDLNAVIVAGAFGNYIQPHNAVRIGLLPPVQEEIIHFVGNAAGAGSQMILLSRKCRLHAAEIAEKTTYIEIGQEADFNDIYAESMMF